MSRTSTNQIIDGVLVNGYDYTNQAWVIGGVYMDCGHPKAGEIMPARVDRGFNPVTGQFENIQIAAREFNGCDCYGRKHQGEACTVRGDGQ